jgi:cobalt-zinc-cadmium efflux system outer membrane protein
LFLLLPAVTSALTLPDAVREALTNNPSLAAARAQIDAAAGRATQSRLWPNPELELSAEDVPTGGGGLSQSKNLIGLSQTVPFPGKKHFEAQAGRHEVRLTEHKYRADERELTRDVTAAFYRALAAAQRVEITRQLAELAESSATTAGKRVAAGGASSQEQLRAEVELERARTDLRARQRERIATQQDLARLLGRRDPADVALAGTLADRVTIPLARQSIEANPQLSAARSERDRAESELRRARLEPMPDVTLGAAIGRDGAFNETLAEFRVSLPLPLIDHGQGRRREARALAAVARADMSGVEQQLLRDLAVAEEDLRAAAEQVAAYRDRIVPKAEEALRMVQAGFDAGKFGFLDLVDTQRTVAETRLGYLDKLLELNLALADIEALAGTQPKE